jgi:glycosyltransferase involved in cell wall biosynthesis
MNTKIVYDYQTFSLQVYGGISRYFYELSSRIARINDYDVEIICPFYVNEYCKNDPSSRNLIKGIKINHIPKTATLRHAINRELSNFLITAADPDIIHETFYALKPIGTKKSKTVITIYDMIHEKFASSLDPSKTTIKSKADAVERADQVICISESTRKDLIEILGVDEAKISTIYVGYTPFENLDRDIKYTPLSEKPYLLYVGKRDVYKNFSRLLEAYNNSSKLRQDFQLICFGGGGFSRAEIEKIEDFQLQEKVIQISGNDNILAHLYRQATAFVYPSLYEGFGIPPLEAMSLDCPVVCSNISSIPEVVGDAGEYFDPYDLDSMIDAIEKVVYTEEISSNLKKLGKDRIKLFSWDLCSEQTQEVYKSLL